MHTLANPGGREPVTGYSDFDEFSPSASLVHAWLDFAILKTVRHRSKPWEVFEWKNRLPCHVSYEGIVMKVSESSGLSFCVN